MDELFEKMSGELNHGILDEMATITTKINKIPNYPEIRVVVNGSTDEPVVGAKIEHGPPHFHLLADGLDVSISIPDYTILAINENKNKQIVFRSSIWQSSGQMVLKRALMTWIDMNQNEQRVFLFWNINNSTLTQAYFNFEQTRKFVKDYMSDFIDIMPSRVSLEKIIIKNSFINKDTLKQVLDNANLQ